MNYKYIADFIIREVQEKSIGFQMAVGVDEILLETGEFLGISDMVEIIRELNNREEVAGASIGKDISGFINGVDVVLYTDHAPNYAIELESDLDVRDKCKETKKVTESKATQIADHLEICNQLDRACESLIESIDAVNNIRMKGFKHSFLRKFVSDAISLEIELKDIKYSSQAFIHGLYLDEHLAKIDEVKIENSINEHEAVTWEERLKKVCGECKFFIHHSKDDNGRCGCYGGSYGGGRTHYNSTCDYFTKD